MLLNAQVIAANIQELTKQGDAMTQPDLAKRMGMSSKTFWTLKEGTGNPQLENIEKAAAYFRRPAWQLLVKDGHKLSRDFDPTKQPATQIEAHHVRIAVLDASPSAGPGGEPVDYPMVLGHIDVAEAWARKRLGGRLEHIRALPVSGDSMSPTINDGDLAFVDTSCTHFAADGVYVIVFNDALLIKRLSADLASRKIRVKSDNALHEPQLVPEEGLTICGRVKSWLSIKEF